MENGGGEFRRVEKSIIGELRMEEMFRRVKGSGEWWRRVQESAGENKRRVEERGKGSGE